MRVWLTLAVLLTAFSAQAATRFALLIGNNVGGIEDGALRWAEEDARRVRDVLNQLGDVAPGRALLLQGASSDEVRAALARLQGQVEEAKRQGYRSEVFIFYSGHGDATALHLGSQRFKLDELKRLIQAIPADTTVTIIDACRARALKSGRRGVGVSLMAQLVISFTSFETALNCGCCASRNHSNSTDSECVTTTPA